MQPLDDCDQEWKAANYSSDDICFKVSFKVKEYSEG